MNKYKLLMCFLIICAVFLPVNALAEGGTVLRFVMGETTYTRNGLPVTFEAAPFNQDGRVMVPLRAVGEALGAELNFKNNVAYLDAPDVNLALAIDVPLPDNMGTPVIISGRIFVCLRFIAKSIGATVKWDENANAAYIYIDADPVITTTPTSAPVSEQGYTWRLSEQIQAWRAAGLTPEEDIGTPEDENPWNAYIFMGGGGNNTHTLTLTEDNALRYTRTYMGFDNGLVFILPDEAAVGDSVRFYFTIIEQVSGTPRGIIARSVGHEMSNYALFAVPEGQPREWQLTPGESHVIEWPITASCLQRPYLHLTGRFDQAVTMDITEITLGAATPEGAAAAAEMDRAVTAQEAALSAAEAAAAQAAAARGTTNNWDLTLPSLAKSFSNFFWFGNIWSTHEQMNDRATHDKYLHHYNQITASNLHKVSNIVGAARDEWIFNWRTADYIVDWAEENELALVWHPLVWHTQSRIWLTNAATGRPLTRAQAMENLHRYISTVASRYSGRVFSYDVVNEVLYLSGADWAANPDWRTHMRRERRGIREGDQQASFWYDAFANGTVGDECGSDYIFYAFKFTRNYDPFAILYYNDYNEQVPHKREAIAQMVEQINERWRNDPLYDGRLLIEGIGMQSHQGIRGWMSDVNLIRDSIERFAETGARISITELNVYLDGGGLVPYAHLLPELFIEQAERYYQIFNFYLEFSDYIGRVTFFIWQDLPPQQGAWRRWPHSQHPALFDLQRQAKPAYFAVLEALKSHMPNISIPVVTTDILRRNNGRHIAMQFSATQNNHAPIHWRISEGSLPPGLALVSTTGTIMGTPTSNGDFTFIIAAENALGNGTREFTISVGTEITITTF